MHICSSRRALRGFTLGQFVIVLAIMMVLAAILFPMFGKARETPSYIPSCQGNLRRVSLGIKQYVQDYDDKFPLYRSSSSPASGWTTGILPYLKSAQLYQCPQELTAGSPTPDDVNYCDYFYNSNVGPQSGGREKAHVSPSTILLGDAAPFSSANSSNGGTITAAGIDGSKDGLAIAQGQWDPAVAGIRHQGGANYLFADGRVKWHSPHRVMREPTLFKTPTFRWSAKNPPVSGS